MKCCGSYRRRAEGFGVTETFHYVFAAIRPKFRFEGKTRLGVASFEFDPTRPVGSWRTAWRTIVKKAGLSGFRFHDLRHTAISSLGEAGVPDRVIMDIAGHVSQRMLRRYSHIQLEAKRVAIQVLSNRPQMAPRNGADVTNCDTKQVGPRMMPVQLVEKNGRPERAGTVDLHRLKSR
jgi:integrase